MKHANLSIFVPHAGCAYRCSFCNQRVISGAQTPPTPETVEALASQSLKALGARASSAQIAFFGGSFTAIDRMDMISLLKAAGRFVGEDGFSGIRISTRPDAVTKEIMDILWEHHVTAIELGVQSMDDAVLSLNGRGHTAADAGKAVRLIREYPMELGLQMMVGLYGDTLDGSLRTARKIADLHPDTVRVYPTVVLKGTGLAALYESGAYRPPGLTETVDACAGMLELFEERGIRVIRMGLHASPDVEEQMIAGVYHPAFRELCESRLYLRRIQGELARRDIRTGRITIYGNPRELSKLTGQKRCNLDALKAQGVVCRVRPDEALEGRQIHIEKEV
ncbi:elongator complex protein 3 [Candidatus Soleaferrea massiliensis]|uniref:elongator complex protein 3 n=1 Tax=Candidatus Soleaferrea massiliensis TaxID=1470354 RepID=UPI000590DC4C|nr:radical SAM protein [Candidatus Soleaferrea massiliensis]